MSGRASSMSSSPRADTRNSAPGAVIPSWRSPWRIDFRRGTQALNRRRPQWKVAMASARDNALVSNVTYGDDAEIHALLSDLRRNDPVHWTEPDGFRPFWAITKYADILEIERLNDRFLNEPRSVLMSKEAEHNLAAMWGGPDPKTGR